MWQLVLTTYKWWHHEISHSAPHISFLAFISAVTRAPSWNNFILQPFFLFLFYVCTFAFLLQREFILQILASVSPLCTSHEGRLALEPGMLNQHGQILSTSHASLEVNPSVDLHDQPKTIDLFCLDYAQGSRRLKVLPKGNMLGADNSSQLHKITVGVARPWPKRPSRRQPVATKAFAYKSLSLKQLCRTQRQKIPSNSRLNLADALLRECRK